MLSLSFCDRLHRTFYTRGCRGLSAGAGYHCSYNLSHLCLCVRVSMFACVFLWDSVGTLMFDTTVRIACCVRFCLCRFCFAVRLFYLCRRFLPVVLQQAGCTAESAHLQQPQLKRRGPSSSTCYCCSRGRAHCSLISPSSPTPQ